MKWFKVSAKIYADPDVQCLSDKAFRVWVMAMAWAADFESDGVYRIVGKTPKAVTELVEKGRLVATPDPTAFAIVGWAKWQKSRAQLEELAEQRRAAGRVGAAKRWHGDSKPLTNGWQADGATMPDLDLDVDLDPDRETSTPTASQKRPNPGQVPDRWPYFLQRLSTEDPHWRQVTLGACQRIANETSRDAVGRALSYAAENPPKVESTAYAWLRGTAHALYQPGAIA